jgi:hypothetical protein
MMRENGAICLGRRWSQTIMGDGLGARSVVFGKAGAVGRRSKKTRGARAGEEGAARWRTCTEGHRQAQPPRDEHTPGMNVPDQTLLAFRTVKGCNVAMSSSTRLPSP